MAPPHGAVGWSTVCNCGMSLSYVLTVMLALTSKSLSVWIFDNTFAISLFGDLNTDTLA